MAQPTYRLLPHPGISHLEYDGTLYELATLTPFQLMFLHGKTPFIEKVPPPAEPEPTAVAPVPAQKPRRKRAAK